MRVLLDTKLDEEKDLEALIFLGKVELLFGASTPGNYTAVNFSVCWHYSIPVSGNPKVFSGSPSSKDKEQLLLP